MAMNYTDNNRISHRQLCRQILLSMIAPFLLCAVGWREILGEAGVAGILLALPFLSLYVIFLIRFSYIQENPERYLGRGLHLLFSLFYLAYVVLTGSFLLSVLGEIVPQYLITGVDSRFLIFLSAAVCGLGTFHGMQKRGRMAEVSGGIVIGGILLLYSMSISQGNLENFPQLYHEQIPLQWAEVGTAAYSVICIFSGIGLLPLILPKVEKASGAAGSVLKAVWILGALLCGGLMLLQGAFGKARLMQEKYPILPLMAGANFPGNLLGRMDVIWMGILLYSLLFAIGSLQYYGTYILKRFHLDGFRWWIAVLMVFFSWIWLPGITLREQYPYLLAYFFCPVFYVSSLLLWIWSRKRKNMGKRHRRERE